MKELLNKAAKFSPDILVEFILALEKELCPDLESKALFRAVLVRFFLSDTLSYPDDFKPENKPKKRYYEEDKD